MFNGSAVKIVYFFLFIYLNILLSLFIFFSVVVDSAVNFSAEINCIPIFNETNFKVLKEAIKILLGCIDLNLTFGAEKPTSTPKNPEEDKVEKWKRSN